MQRHVDDRDCSEVIDLLEMWVDGDLGEDDAARVRTHLEGCAECRSEGRLAAQIASELRSLPAFDLPDRVARTARRRVQGSLWTRLGEVIERSAARPLPVLAAAAALVLMFIVLAPWRGPSQPQFSDQDVARATADTKLALAYVASATRRAELRVTRTILEDGMTGRTVRKFRQTIHAVGGHSAAATLRPATPLRQTTTQGS